MIVKVKSKDARFTIPVPNALVFNRLVSHIIAKHTDIPFDTHQLNYIFDNIKAAKRILKGRPLVEVESADGEVVIVKL